MSVKPHKKWIDIQCRRFSKRYSMQVRANCTPLTWTTTTSRDGREGRERMKTTQKKRNNLAEVNMFELWTIEERNLTISTVWIMSFWAQKSFWISYIGSYNLSISYQDHSRCWTRLKMFLRSFLHCTHRRILSGIWSCVTKLNYADETLDLPWRMLSRYHELPLLMIPSEFPCEMIGLK